MAVTLQAVTIDVPDPPRTAAFWAALLDRSVTQECNGARHVGGSATQLGLRFLPAEHPPTDADRLHLHLTSAEPGDQERTVERALALGASPLDVGQRPEEGHVVLADPAGDPFCVIEHGNRFLAGCGPLGEVTCEGTREVGLFWHRALGWPLGWDQDGETSVQSPAGGTKVSWGGPPLAPRTHRNRQRLHLVAADPAVEAQRLVGLGARELTAGPAGIELADPDGNEFTIARYISWHP